MRPTKLTKIRQYVTLLTHLQCIETLSGYHSQAIVLMWFLLQLYSRLSLKRCFSQPCGFYCTPHVAAFNMPRSLVSASIPSLSHVINYSVIDPVMFQPAGSCCLLPRATSMWDELWFFIDGIKHWGASMSGLIPPNHSQRTVAHNRIQISGVVFNLQQNWLRLENG